MPFRLLRLVTIFKFALASMVWGTQAFAAASPLDFTVNFSEAVTVDTSGGTPRIPVNIGGVTRYASYVSGSGSANLIFRYTPAAGDVDLDGIALSSPLDLNGGNIADASGNMASLSYAPPATNLVRINYPSLNLNVISDTYNLNGVSYTSLSNFLSASGGTLTRASSGSYFDSSGIMQTAASNVPRIDYDPVALTRRGLLIEESRTNSLLHSSALNTTPTWTTAKAAITANAAIAPDGTISAERLVPDTTNDYHYVTSTLSLTAGSSHTVSVYAKANGYNYMYINVAESGTNRYLVFNLQTGTTGSSGNISTGTIEPAGNGWYRCTMTFTPSAGGGGLYLHAHNASSLGTFAGDGTGGIYLWGAQLERGAVPTSYIATAASTVTRAADHFIVPGGTWLNTVQGTLQAEARNGLYTNVAGLVSLRNSALVANDRVSIIRTASTSIEIQVRDANVSQFQTNVTTLGHNQTNKVNLAYIANNFRGAANGTLSAPDSSGTVPGTLNEMIIGGWAGSTAYFNGHIRSITYYPLRLADSQLQLLSQ